MPKQKPTSFKYNPPTSGLTGIVQGILVDSQNEYNVAIALDKLGIGFGYQVPIGAGNGIRGGVVVDFVTYNPPQPRAVFVGNPGYFHNKRTETEDILDHAMAEHQYGRGNVVDLSTDETATPELAMAAVKRKIW
jgi:hypothetical protein